MDLTYPLKFLAGDLKEQNLSKLGTAKLQLVSFWFWNDLVMKTSYISKQINNIQVHIIVAILESFGKMKQLINCSVVISTHKIRNKLIVKSVNQHKGQYIKSLLRGDKKLPTQPLSKWIMLLGLVRWVDEAHKWRNKLINTNY